MYVLVWSQDRCYGAPASKIPDFARSFFGNWFAYMSGGPSVPVAIAALYVESNVAKILLWVTAVGCIVISAYFVWRAERITVIELKAKLASKIRLFINPHAKGVMEIPAALLSQPGIGIKGKWIQFSVSCATDAPLVDCEAWLASIERLDGEEIGKQLVEESVHCGWSQLEKQKITLRPLLEQRVNLLGSVSV